MAFIRTSINPLRLHTQTSLIQRAKPLGWLRASNAISLTHTQRVSPIGPAIRSDFGFRLFSTSVSLDPSRLGFAAGRQSTVVLGTTAPKAFEPDDFDELPVGPVDLLSKNAAKLPALDKVPVTIVSTREKAREVLARLKTLSTVHACDTEVADIDVKEQGPVGNGKVRTFDPFFL